MNTEDDLDDQQRWIDDLLRRGATGASESPPDSLLASFRASITWQRRRNFIACGLAAAASLLIAAGWTMLRYSQSTDFAEHNIAESSGELFSPAAISPQIETSRATFVSDSNTIAVPVESTSADVTIVRLYPTTDAEQRWQLDYALQTTNLESNGG